MLPNWTTERVITCITDDGERVQVIRQYNKIPGGLPRKRYVLGNSQDVVVEADSQFRVLGSDIALHPMTGH